ncbi:acyl-CoA thioester hydrolase [Frankia sp. EI5c]|uniref:acyl-CoA thioesterase n=1 Tax=Frankia sp. EI5c TaxID=683316 RepID=UPI0007C314FB|nr:acyl-CoA thioesterase [Frankia sp. EI5c]OAA25739.1 acyl-CoA thioester hydrolase [Frankia sp. EI5c]
MGAKYDPARAELTNYPFVLTMQPRFGDMDSLGHVNNVAIAAMFEEARVAMNRELLGASHVALPQDERPLPVVAARVEINYLGEVRYPGSYEVGVGIGRLGSSSIVQVCGLFEAGVCLALCDTVLVHRGPTGPAPVPGQVRELLLTRTFPAKAGVTA